MFKPTTILHPTDFHPTSIEAFGVAEELAGVYGAKLLVMHVQSIHLLRTLSSFRQSSLTLRRFEAKRCCNWRCLNERTAGQSNTSFRQKERLTRKSCAKPMIVQLI